MEIKIARIGSHETVRFAAEELRRYLHRIDAGVDVHIRVHKTYDENVTGVIWLGMSDEFNKYLPEVADRRYDDSVYIDLDNNAGIITGTNERSVLLAVYRLLRELGCVWHRPGEEGEKIPEKKLEPLKARIEETPTSRHRCIDMIGSTAPEVHEQLADWLPKVGMNSVFIEFQTPHENYKAWFTHENNPLIPAEEYTFEDTLCYYESFREEVKKRSLLFHSFGHGFTLYPIGVDVADAFDEVKPEDVPEHIRPKLAMVNGVRAYAENKAMFTPLCYSQEELRHGMAKAYVQKVKENPDVDFVHFWLSDGCNNHCECEECAKHNPSDFYVMMLNDIDRMLTEEGINTRVVFLIYVDLLWAPIEERLENPDRFIMMFAPITRLFNESYAEKHEGLELRPYTRNRLIWPMSPHENLMYLEEWRRNTFNGETFVFDYHLIWNHFKDMGYAHISEILARDIEAYDDCRLAGLLSAQTTRAHFPTNLPMYTMARKLWNKHEDYDKICRDYYREAFGKDWAKAKTYCEKISDAFSVIYSFDAGCRDFDKEKKLLETVRTAVADLVRTDVHCDGFDEQVQWYNLGVHTDLVERIAEMLDNLYKRNFEKAEALREEAFQIAREYELTSTRSLDVKTFVFIWQIIYDSIKNNTVAMVQD